MNLIAGKALDKLEAKVNELIEENALKQAFIDANPWGVLVVDKDFYITFVNQTMSDLCGWTWEDIIGQHLHTLLPEGIRSIHTEHEKGYRENPRARHGDEPFSPKLLRKDNSTLNVEISLAPVKVKGEIYFYASIRSRDSLPGA